MKHFCKTFQQGAVPLDVPFVVSLCVLTLAFFSRILTKHNILSSDRLTKYAQSSQQET